LTERQGKFMKLKEILVGIDILDGGFNSEIEIKDLIFDSRKAFPNTLFVCIKGYQSDGHKFASDAYEKGVRVFVAENKLDLPDDATVIFVKSTRKFLAKASANFFENPAKNLLTIAVTGTKGKTSTCYMIKSIFEEFGKKVGIMGNIGILYGDVSEHLSINTPESYVIHKHMRGMVDCGCEVMVMEASSQGFMLDRTYGIEYDAGIYTNLSPDHISAIEHRDFEHYLECKRMLFYQCKKGFANIDSEHFYAMTADIKCPLITFGVNGDADFRAIDPAFFSKDNSLQTEFTCIEKSNNKRTHIKLNTPGYFSLYNAVAAISVTRSFGIPYPAIREGLKKAFVKGRMEIVPTHSGYTVIIDYAHNELSVESLFKTIKYYKPNRIISVFGCGGNRSKLRRYSMGEIIGKNSDISVITSDNSRYEKVEDIVKDILVGINKTNNNHIIIYDRKKAIHKAIDIAEKGDVILLIGKGHEDYEDIEGVKRPFCERQIVLDYFKSKSI